MSDYIEREALLAAYDAAHEGAPGGARKLIEDASAADVAPVVRCAKCVFRQMTGRCVKTGFYVNDDDFCSNGERDGDTDG